ncbi:MAG: hypothetical protein ACREHG_08565 [Candidatus Saccharimonadales bacterium]
MMAVVTKIKLLLVKYKDSVVQLGPEVAIMNCAVGSKRLYSHLRQIWIVYNHTNLFEPTPQSIIVTSGAG